VPVLANYILNRVFADRGGHTNVEVQSYLHAYILATDKALRAYHRGRDLLSAYSTSENRTVLLFEGIGEFETCVSTLRRALRLAERMATHQENPEISREQRRLLDSYQRAVRPVRDAVEHMDDDIAKGQGREGEPVMLAVSQDGSRLEIGQHHLLFTSLAAALTQLHSLAAAVASRARTTTA
jgi:hypothetical protein